ncbi:hypothetical protein C8R44DRAFT_871381 [Mycena epipterygia]|nr:hypothetical protein C8R44DRAFT_871381 [Mycena epipterygia]
MDPLDAATADKFPDLPVRADITVNPLTATEYLHLGRLTVRCRQCVERHRRCSFSTWATSCGECLITANRYCDFANRLRYVAVLRRYRDELINSNGPNMETMVAQFYVDLSFSFTLFDARLGQDETYQHTALTNVLDTITSAPVLTSLCLLSTVMDLPVNLTLAIEDRMHVIYESFHP